MENGVSPARRYINTCVFFYAQNSDQINTLRGIPSLAQLGSVSPTFGATNKEFAAIATEVSGGTSLFGGLGRVFPGTVAGAVLIQSVENGLVIVNADPYLYAEIPIVIAGLPEVAV